MENADKSNSSLDLMRRRVMMPKDVQDRMEKLAKLRRTPIEELFSRLIDQELSKGNKSEDIKQVESENLVPSSVWLTAGQNQELNDFARQHRMSANDAAIAIVNLASSCAPEIQTSMPTFECTPTGTGRFQTADAKQRKRKK